VIPHAQVIVRMIALPDAKMAANLIVRQSVLVLVMVHVLSLVQIAIRLARMVVKTIARLSVKAVPDVIYLAKMDA
jgi:hypothetical protein